MGALLIIQETDDTEWLKTCSRHLAKHVFYIWRI